MYSCTARSLNSATSRILYGRDPVLFTVELTALKAASPSADNILLSVWDGGRLLGALVRTPPYAAMASGLPPVAAPFAAKILAQAGYELAGISGLPPTQLPSPTHGASQPQQRQPSRSKCSSTG
jgi:hypothetical protein